jgi:hypothetical protein
MPEALARESIDEALRLAGWLIQDAKEADVDAEPGVAVREFPLGRYGFADYLLYVKGKAAGIIEAKKTGTPLTGVEPQTERYCQSLPRTPSQAPCRRRRARTGLTARPVCKLRADLALYRLHSEQGGPSSPWALRSSQQRANPMTSNPSQQIVNRESPALKQFETIQTVLARR